MTIALLIARLALAAVFAVAGLSKLADLRGSRQAIAGFGVPAILAPALGQLIPLLELAITVGLILSATAWVASLAAAALLLTFIAAIGINLARGRTPDCHCFGQLHSEPIGPAVLVRNAFLLALAAFVGIAGVHSAGISATNWIDALTVSQLVGGIVALLLFTLLVAEGSLLLNLLRQNGRLLLRLEALESGVKVDSLPATQPAAPPMLSGLPVGSVAPAFSLPGLYGETLTLDALRARGKDVLLLFGSPGCGPCTSLLPDIATWQREHGDRVTVALVSTGTAETNRSKLASHDIGQVLLQEKYETAEAYKFRGTPSAVFVSPAGTIATGLVAGADAIRAMVNERLGIGVDPDGAAAASPNPAGRAPTSGATDRGSAGRPTNGGAVSFTSTTA